MHGGSRGSDGEYGGVTLSSRASRGTKPRVCGACIPSFNSSLIQTQNDAATHLRTNRSANNDGEHQPTHRRTLQRSPSLRASRPTPTPSQPVTNACAELPGHSLPPRVVTPLSRRRPRCRRASSPRPAESPARPCFASSCAQPAFGFSRRALRVLRDGRCAALRASRVRRAVREPWVPWGAMLDRDRPFSKSSSR